MSPRPPNVEPAAPEQVQAAADLFEARQSGTAEPEGTWEDRVWLPSAAERGPCCEGLTPDPLKDPQKLRSHCRTLLHVAQRFGVDSRLLRAELRRRRDAREASRAGAGSAGPGPRRVRGSSAARLASPAAPRPAPFPPLPDDGSPASEAAALHAKLVRLVGDKQAELRDLAERAAAHYQELCQLLDDDAQAVEVVLAETAAADLAADLKAVVDDIQNLVITRDTLRRML